jgi:spermidine/putrescine transport system substrate-binding protein
VTSRRDRPEPPRSDLWTPLGRNGRRLSRRDLLRYVGAGAGAVGIGAVLAACGVGGTRRETQPPSPGQTPTGTTSATASPTATLGEETGELVMANWIAYIDKVRGQSPTLMNFREEFGIDMVYAEDINDNEEFFGTDLQQPLAAGQPTGWDIVVLTDWMIAKMIRFGYLEPLHHEAIPNFEKNAAEKFKDPFFDPGNAHSIPWAAGITGIGYNRALTGRDLESVEDLFDPAFEGHVGMFKEMRDSFGLVLLSMGVEPEEATIDDVEKAADRLVEQREQGIVRAYYGNDYLDQLGTGNLWVSMAWSGDVFGLAVDDPNLKFIVPKEGGLRWSDNMCIPKGAEHVPDAHLFMDYVYRPRIAANITEWVWYESPVEPVKEIVAEDARESGDEILQQLAESPLVFPTPETDASTHGIRVLDAEEEEAWADLFDQVIQG